MWKFDKDRSFPRTLRTSRNLGARNWKTTRHYDPSLEHFRGAAWKVWSLERRRLAFFPFCSSFFRVHAPPATVRSRAIRAKLRDLPPRVRRFEFESKMREEDWRKIRRMNAIQMLGSNFLFYVTSWCRDAFRLRVKEFPRFRLAFHVSAFYWHSREYIVHKSSGIYTEFRIMVHLRRI